MPLQLLFNDLDLIGAGEKIENGKWRMENLFGIENGKLRMENFDR
jgi:hypothetical protein